MIGFNQWFKYSRKHDYFKNGELAGLEDKYRDDSSMYHFVSLLLEALKDKLLHIERNGTVYDIPICNIEDIYYWGGVCTIDFVENGHFYETEEGVMTARTTDSLEIKYPEIKII